MKKLLLLSFIGSAAGFSACLKSSDDEPVPQPPNIQPGNIQATGVLQRQGITTYMYGTHILVIGSTKGYALKSTVINLDSYINKTVALTANQVAGYPVDGGPIYLDVQTIK